MLTKLSEFNAVRIHDLIRLMVAPKNDSGYDFNPEWIQNRGWSIVPVEDSSHFTDEEIERIVAALNATGHKSGFAIGALDLPTEFANVFELSISEGGFKTFNAEFGILRFLLTDASLSWAISCNEWFNLFAGPESLIEQMLGVPINIARRDFLAYAGLVEQGGSEGLMLVARKYS